MIEIVWWSKPPSRGHADALADGWGNQPVSSWVAPINASQGIPLAIWLSTWSDSTNCKIIISLTAYFASTTSNRFKFQVKRLSAGKAVTRLSASISSSRGRLNLAERKKTTRRKRPFGVTCSSPFHRNPGKKKKKKHKTSTNFNQLQPTKHKHTNKKKTNKTASPVLRDNPLDFLFAASLWRSGTRSLLLGGKVESRWFR